MANQVKHLAYSSFTSALTTELNSITTAANTAASAAIDNTSTLDLYMDLRLDLAAQSSARSAGATVNVYMVQALDASTYADVHETTADLVAVFPLDAATTARKADRRDIPIPPGLFKLFARNVTGQTLAASGSIISYRFHSINNNA